VFSPAASRLGGRLELHFPAKRGAISKADAAQAFVTEVRRQGAVPMGVRNSYRSIFRG
jgi:hypothetical protein